MKRKAWQLHDTVLVLLFVLVVGAAVSNSFRSDVKADDIMIVNKVYIPDFESGEDPPVVYYRSVLEEVHADWEVKIYSVETKDLVCTGSGRGHYLPGEDVSGNSLSWYVGKFCDYDLGQYLARTEWIFDNGLRIRNTSNVFTVFPEGRRRGPPRTNDNR